MDDGVDEDVGLVAEEVSQWLRPSWFPGRSSGWGFDWLCRKVFLQQRLALVFTQLAAAVHGRLLVVVVVEENVEREAGEAEDDGSLPDVGRREIGSWFLQTGRTPGYHEKALKANMQSKSDSPGFFFGRCWRKGLLRRQRPHACLARRGDTKHSKGVEDDAQRLRGSNPANKKKKMPGGQYWQ